MGTKVFEVVTEKLEEDEQGEKIVKYYQYVTSEDDELLSVASYFTTFCEEYDFKLISIKELLTVTNHIETS